MKENRSQSVVEVLSGGIDSSVLLYWLLDHGYRVEALTFDYGQRHRKEIDAAKAIAGKAGVNHIVVDISSIKQLLSSNALTGNVEVPEGYYTDESMKITVVPCRNMLFLTLAAAYAISKGYDTVAYAAHTGDHPIYPDCRQPFVASIEQTIQLGNDLPHFTVIAPFIRLTKAEIVRLGKKLGVPFELTWSCYKGGEKHCGKCGTCTERKEAFALANVLDPTEYEV